MGADGAGAAREISLEGGGRILYVEDRCPYCVAELDDLWREARGVPPGRLRIVRGPESDGPHPGIVPVAWSGLVVSDRDGSLGRELGVGAVPFLALADEEGTVVETVVGRVPRGRLRSLLGLEDPTDEGGRHEDRE